MVRLLKEGMVVRQIKPLPTQPRPAFPVQTVRSNLVSRARIFAIVAHSAIGQVRKYTNEPYWIHCENVAKLLDDVGCNNNVISAGFLHDVVEDTKITIELIKTEFNAEIAQLVSEVTDTSRPEDGNRKQRKEIDRNHLAQASPDAQTIKLADLIDNSSSIMKHDPNFAKIYMLEKAELLKVLTKGNKILWKMANEILQEYKTVHKLMNHK